ncbi:hypothetical protein VMF7928_04469 [Vibrio marisflavi CECT 7928]|uniref:Uncharacterized protein n=1 Tax=Vibrio marisflavi CECT 7928 TaxID=634439 RepID=A0ABN8E9B6_9VIBR|nr:hypothetical protein VMF7928_04469 [Vibrio marisflavi CECT 7928]
MTLFVTISGSACLIDLSGSLSVLKDMNKGVWDKDYRS